jgi:hypothetical protein
MVRVTDAPASEVPVTTTLPAFVAFTEEGGVTTGVAETVSFVFVVVAMALALPAASVAVAV